MVTFMDIYGIGNPLIDIILTAEESDLRKLDLKKGSMHLIDKNRRAELLRYIEHRLITYTCGGSCPNTLITLASLGIGTTLAGKVGDDYFGTKYIDTLLTWEVNSDLVVSQGETGSSLIFITPDSERTMNTYLGVNREFGISDLRAENLEKARFFYFTGYMWDTEPQKEAVKSALRIARENGVSCIFDVADPFAVDRYRDDFIRIIAEDIDIVFMNHEEACRLCRKSTLEECREFITPLCNVVVMKDGVRGSMVLSGKECVTIPARLVRATDTTGAGDIYAAGFIYGILRNFAYRECAIFASYLASRIVTLPGAQFSHASIEEILDDIRTGRWNYLD